MFTTRSRSRRRLRAVAATAVAAVLLSSAAGPASAHELHGTPFADPKPIVVLVHGAWADSSSWDGVVRRLLHDGYPVRVFPTPLRSLSGDSAALRAYVDAICGPVVLVGHSYGGAVVTDAATGEPNVQALVYVDAFAPAEGQTVFDLPGSDSALANPDPTQVFDPVPTWPLTPASDLYIKQNVFPQAFANDLPLATARVLAVTQRPVTLGALLEPSSAPAWSTIPSWYEIGTIDKVIPASAQAAMAATAGAHVTRVRTGHLPMISAPGAVTATIESAANATT